MKKHFTLLVVNLFSVSVFTACDFQKASPTDIEQNKYYKVYTDIYSKWGNEPIDSTQKKLMAYLQEFPENADAQMFAGNIFCKKGEYEKAVLNYKTAIHLKPSQSVYFSALGSAFNILGQTDSAEKYLLQALYMKDSSYTTYLSASLLFLKNKNKEKSYGYASSVLPLAKHSPVAYSGLSYVYSQWHDTLLYNTMLRKALELGLKDSVAFRHVLTGKTKLEDYYRTYY